MLVKPQPKDKHMKCLRTLMERAHKHAECLAQRCLQGETTVEEYGEALNRALDLTFRYEDQIKLQTTAKVVRWEPSLN